MRILLVSNFFPPHIIGGAEIVAERQARELVRRGHEVLVIGGAVPTADNPAGSMKPEFDQGFEIQRVFLRSMAPDDSFRWPSVERWIASFVTARKIDIVHLHNLVGIGAGSIPAVQVAGARSIVTMHDYWGFCLRQTLLRPDNSFCGEMEECAVCQRSFVHEGERLPIRLRRDYTAWCLNQADLLISPSRYLAGAYGAAAIGKGKIEVLSNGLDLLALPPVIKRQDGLFRFLCSASLWPHKGIEVLLDAVRNLAEETTLAGRWQIILAGNGPLLERARLTAEDLVLGGEVTSPLLVTGHLPRAELLVHMAEADVVILPSIWPENEPLSLLEGAASGAALLVTRAGGASDLVEHEQTGLLVPLGDARALADSMRRLITENELAARLGAANLARRVSIDETHTIDRLESIYKMTLEAPVQLSPNQDVSNLVLVGPGSAPDDVIELMGCIHQHLKLKDLPRFLRHNWVTPDAWKRATLLWLWHPKDAEELILAALRRNIPVLASATIGLQHWIDLGAPVLTYRSALEALAALQVLLERPAIRSHLVNDVLLEAHAIWPPPEGAFGSPHRPEEQNNQALG